MKPIELNILYNSEDQDNLQDLEIQTEIKDCIIDKMTFYSINSIAPYHEDDVDYTSINSGGIEYICIENYYKVQELILKNL